MRILLTFRPVYHNLSGNVCFVDAHVERHRWMDPRSTFPLSPTQLYWSIASPNNPDVAWLQQTFNGACPVDPVQDGASPSYETQ